MSVGAVQVVAAERFEASEPHMGTLVSITLYADTPEQAHRAFAAAFRRIAELDSILSDYKPKSELSRACASSGVMSQELKAVLRHAQRISEQTAGAFDITAGPLTELWRRARTAKRLPDASALREALSRTGYTKLHVGKVVRCGVPGMKLDAGGIAKGFAADEALTALLRAGVCAALVAVSGDIVAGDPPPGRSGWRVRVQNEVLTLANAAVSTSGDEFQYAEIDGVRYSHIIDPRTGLALRNSRPVSVVARSGIEADSLATAFAVQGRGGIVRLIPLPEPQSQETVPSK